MGRSEKAVLFCAWRFRGMEMSSMWRRRSRQEVLSSRGIFGARMMTWRRGVVVEVVVVVVVGW